MNLKGRHAALVSVMAATVLGFVLWGGPRDPDTIFPTAAVLGCLLITVGVIAAAIGVGATLVRALRWEGTGVFEWLLLGTATLGWIGHILGLAGAMGTSWKPLWLGILALGILSLARLPTLRRERASIPWIAIVLGTVVAYRVFLASVPVGHTDPPLYHLHSPRIWWDHGSIYLPKGDLVVFVSAFWETLLSWGIAIFAGEGSRGLIEGQLFGQWVHVLVGMGGTGLALRALAARAFGDSAWSWLIALAGVASMPFISVTPIAKNDWGSVFWLLGGMVLLLQGSGSRALLGAWLLAMGAVTRFTSAFFLVGFVPVLFVVAKGRARQLPLWAGGVALGAAPILLRNWIETSNPFFPWLHSLFPSPLIGPTVAALPEVGTPPFSWRRMLLIQKLRIFATQTPLGAPFLLWPLGERLWPRLKALRAPAVATAISIAIALPWPVTGTFQVRWFGAVLVLQGAMGAAVIAALATRLAPRFVLPVAAAIALVVAGVSTDWAGWERTLQSPDASEVIRDPARMFVAGDAKAWLRMNARPGELIVTTYDSAFYYLIPLPVENLAGGELDREAHDLRRPESVLAMLEKMHAKYLLDTLYYNPIEGPAARYWGPYSHFLEPVILEHLDTIRFAGKFSLVVDLDRLSEEVLASCLLGFGQYY